MSKQKYINLHCHSTYSFQDGLGTPQEIFEKAKGMGFNSHAITDHGNFCNFGDSYIWQLNNKDFKVIYGCEFYLRDDADYVQKRRLQLDKYSKEKFMSPAELKEERKKLRKYNHIILLAKNKKGLRALFEMNKFAWSDGFYHKPCLDMVTLKKYKDVLKENVIATSACLSGQLSELILNKDGDKLKKRYDELINIFGKNYYLEIQINEMSEQEVVNLALAKLDKERLIVTNDNHYVCKEHVDTQTILLNLQIKQTKKDKDKDKNQTDITWEFDTKELFLKSTDDIFRTRDKYQENITDKILNKAFENTLKIEDEIELILMDNSPKLFILPENRKKDTFSLLEKKCKAGLKKRKLENKKEYVDRIEFELKVIKEKKYVDYFLMVEKFIEIAIENGINVGAGRGSAAGSLVNYVLGITEVDPIKFELFFERFLDYERDDFPDIDLDFSDAETMKHLIRDFVGEENFAYITTYNSFTLKNLFRDVCRFFDVELEIVNNITKNIDSAETEYRKFHEIPVIEPLPKEASKDIYDSLIKGTSFEKNYPEIVKHIGFLLQQYRQFGKHAGGVIVFDDIANEIPVVYSKTGDVQSCLTESGTSKQLSKLGYIKYDVLGLFTLTIQPFIEKLIGRSIEKEINPNTMDFEDKRIYRLFKTGHTIGIFQFKGDNITEYTKSVVPDSFSEVCDISACYRPAPLKAGMDKEYLFNKKNPDKIKYAHKKLEKILGYSKGLPLYQEQIMQICHELGGLTLSESNIVRKAISKTQKIDEVLQFKKRMLKSFKENGMTEKQSEELWGMLEKYSGYGFNKSHSVCYTVNTMQTAYMKTYYPKEFYSAYLVDTKIKTEHIKPIRNEMLDFADIDLLIPKFETATNDSSPYEDNVVLGLNKIKGVGEKASIEIVETIEKVKSMDMDVKELISYFLIERPFENKRSFTKKVFEILCRIGFFDSLTKNRMALEIAYKNFDIGYKEFSTIFKNKKRYMELYKKSQIKQKTKERKVELKNKVGSATKDLLEKSLEEKPIEIDKLKKYSSKELYEFELEYCGFSKNNIWDIMDVSGYESKSGKKLTNKFDEISYMETVVFYLESVRYLNDSKKRKMAFMTISDIDDNKTTVAVFSSKLQEMKDNCVDIKAGHFYKAKLKKNTSKYGGFLLESKKIVKIK